MSAKRKLEHIEELKTFSNFFEFPEGLKGKWHQQIFKNSHPITLELGCGKGEYSVNLAKYFPERNFVGVDIKGPRIWKGAKTGMEEILPNLVFARFLIENIHRYFSENEISEIWVPFPDPYPKPSKANKRLISPRFLNEYKAIIEIGGLLHFKTDNADLFAYGYEELIKDENFELDCSTDNLYESDLVDDYTSIQTTYETIFRREGMSIKYLRAHLVSKPLRGMLDR